jgi:hypothetical protein
MSREQVLGEGADAVPELEQLPPLLGAVGEQRDPLF